MWLSCWCSYRHLRLSRLGSKPKSSFGSTRSRRVRGVSGIIAALLSFTASALFQSALKQGPKKETCVAVGKGNWG